MWTCLVVAGLLSGSAHARQPSASVSGTVVDVVTRLPVPGVEVDLIWSVDGAGGVSSTGIPPDSESYRATTDSEGRFAFVDVPGRTYRLVAIHPGAYVPVEYGQSTFRSPGRPLRLEAGGDVRDIELRLVPTGVVTGTVSSQDGSPLRGSVHALRTAYRNGESTLTIVQTVRADEEGRYRFFWLAPGTYFISTAPAFSGQAVDRPGLWGTRELVTVASIEPHRLVAANDDAGAPAAPPIEETEVVVYYPGTRAMEDAAPIAVGPGGTVSGVDFVAPRVRAYHVSGIVRDPTGSSPAGYPIELKPRAWVPHMVTNRTTVNMDGTFDLPAVVPGSYVLTARSVGNRSAAIALEMGDGDIRGLDVSIDPVVLAGTIRAEGTNAFLSVPTRLAFRPVAGGPEVTATVSPDGAFEVAGLLDETYRFHESSLGNFAGSVRSIRSASGESLDEFRLRPADSPVEIVLAGDGPRVRGRVLGPDGASPDGRVVLIPDDSGRKDLYRESGTGAGGTFAFLRVVPGAYTLFAWDFVEDGAWWNTEFLEAQKELGTPVRVQEDDVEIDVPLIPADEGDLP